MPNFPGLSFKNSLAVSPWATWNGSLDGSPVVVASITPVYESVTILSSTLALAAYNNSADSKNYVVAGTISGNSVSWGTPVVIGLLAAGTDCEVLMTSATSALATYSDGGGVATMAVAISVSGTTVSLGTPIIVATDADDDIRCAILSSTKAIAVYLDNNQNGALAKIIDISTLVLTVGTEFNFITNAVASGANWLDVAKISSTQALVVYSYGDNGNLGMSQVLDISGDTITGNTEYAFTASQTNKFVLSALSGTLFGCLYLDITNSNQSYIVILSVSGKIVSNGTPVFLTAINNSSRATVSLCKADNQTLFSVWKVDSTHIKAATITVSGTAATVNALVQYKSTNTTLFASANIDSTHVITLYKDNANSNKLTSRISAAV